MFKQQKGKNAFLLKKNQEKQKAQDKLKNHQLIIKIQKNLRAFLNREYLIQNALLNRNIRFAILMNTRLNQYSHQQIIAFIESMSKEAQGTKNYYLSKFIINNLQSQQFSGYCISILENSLNQHLRKIVFNQHQFVGILQNLLLQKKGAKLLNLSIQWLSETNNIDKINPRLLLQSILIQFSSSFVEIETVYGGIFHEGTILAILNKLVTKGYQIQEVNLENFTNLIAYYLKNVNRSMEQNREYFSEQSTISYLLSQLLKVGLTKHEQITKMLIKQNHNIISLIEDQETLEYVENKLRQSQVLEEFTNDFLGSMKLFMTNGLVNKLFQNQRYKNINAILLKSVGQLSVLFEDRRLIFIQQLISSNAILKPLVNSKDAMFFEGLKMRLLGMDDRQFDHFNIFTVQDWQNIIYNCISIADIKIQKIIQRYNNQANIKQLTPFKKRSNDDLQLKTIVDLMNNLYKKVLRTNKFSSSLFVNLNISQILHNFLFGKGARRAELFLKQMPFIFSFESRMAKFKQFVKADKKNYDRSLFLQEQIDQDLIISVRRGNQFQDAFQACMNRDLRKKYKIIFFNQQNLEEEGVDGGGIIKQFINRVLRASFSEQYGLFMETALNQIIPNPYSPHTVEYQFVGKLVGKAVYEGINIDQKFAEPFLNLLIGRFNTFEDMQYIDPEVYQGLLNIKHSQYNIEQMQQTFVIFDKLPNGNTKYIDLLCPNKPPSLNHKQVLVTNENKMQFIMNYSDFKCNKQIEQKTRYFRKGFLKVMKPQWLTMFSNQELNQIISGTNPDFNVEELRLNTVYNDYHQKEETIVFFWQVLKQMSPEQKSLFLLYVTSCSRPPTLGFSAMKPKMCINRDNDISHLPTANTCMNVLRLPNYKNKALLRDKLIYAINSKAGFEFA